MKTSDKKKAFDAVRMMREIRDRISADTQGMNLEQLRAYIGSKLNEVKSDPIGMK